MNKEVTIDIENPKDNDLISRQAVLDVINLNWEYRRNCIRAIEKLPPVKQEPRWIPVSERLPNHDEYIKNNGLFNVSDGNRTYSEWFDIYDTQKFGEPTMYGFRVDHAVIAWMPLPKPYKPQESEEISDTNLKMWQEIFKAESDRKCHTCKHYTSGENDGSCGSYICKGYSNWERSEKG